MASSLTAAASRLSSFTALSVWQEFTPLAREHGAVNLGQGFPDWTSPRFVMDAMVEAVTVDHANQYARSQGHPPLVQALAARYSKWLGRTVNWETEVTVGVGASESLYAIMQSFVNPGDEVVLISPAFDIYSAQVDLAGGKCVYVPLRLKPTAADPTEQEWTLDMAELRAAFTPATRAIIINTPQNPTGKMFSRDELESIRAILADYPRVLAISDEVYEHITYDDREHVRLASLPGMWDRCLTVSSSGKTFSITGWKVGWIVGHADLIKSIAVTNSWIQFSVSTPAQAAVAKALDVADRPYEGYPSYYAWLRAEYTRKRDILAKGLRSAGLKPVVPEGGFFIIADTRDVDVPRTFLDTPTPASGPIMRRDWATCRYLTMDVGVACIPPSAFFQEKDKELAKYMARFAFCKEDASLHEACTRLAKLKGAANKPSA